MIGAIVIMNNDAISRQEALDEWNKLSERGRTEFDQVLMMLPSTQPETCKYTVNAVAVEEMLKDLLPEIGMWEIEGDEVKTAICETVRNALEGLWKLPFAQPEIVRCKECINHGKGICYFWSHFYGTINTPDDGFCHKAERRTDG